MNWIYDVRIGSLVNSAGKSLGSVITKSNYGIFWLYSTHPTSQCMCLPYTKLCCRDVEHKIIYSYAMFSGGWQIHSHCANSERHWLGTRINTRLKVWSTVIRLCNCLINMTGNRVSHFFLSWHSSLIYMQQCMIGRGVSVHFKDPVLQSYFTIHGAWPQLQCYISMIL